MDQLADPLNDPLPGRGAAAESQPEPQREPEPEPQPQPEPQPPVRPRVSSQPLPQEVPPAPAPASNPPAQPPRDDETVGLRIAGPRPAARADRPGTRPPGASDPTATLMLSAVHRTRPPVPGGRAERRRAAKRGGAADVPPAAAGRPMSRVEARQAARARQVSPGVIASRFIGEAFITLGLLMLLFVTYQLWWTNILAHQQAGGAANSLQKQWEDGDGGDRKAGAFSPGQGFAIMYIPKLDVKVPIAEGIDKHSVLDRGMVGHYAEGKLKTAMPADKKGNFSVAGHRNTHGEPFRYINKLTAGDEIVVETRQAYYTYEMASILPQTPPSNVDVIRPVPPGSGFTEPGRYLTLTTCTPEFTSTYRMIVWGKMVDVRPRGKGKPDALVG
ncbi:class E sortase [Streptomyces sp. H27-D2]|uniref:class E sortase n=1 Tax=Streptomyces sp. H27-D2 TaxID=3046304 RepID=UPI002DC03038|nr:class E sortase [Streptomyces sp. H27-D2]MEC4017407.1 class E sortase [Streptomyces sp. H27-D2]